MINITWQFEGHPTIYKSPLHNFIVTTIKVARSLGIDPNSPTKILKHENTQVLSDLEIIEYKKIIHDNPNITSDISSLRYSSWDTDKPKTVPRVTSSRKAKSPATELRDVPPVLGDVPDGTDYPLMED